MKNLIIPRAISLTQPWATLVAIGAKRYETRSWATTYRGGLAIHASKEFPAACRELCAREPFSRVLAAAGIYRLDQLPRGAILATAGLAYCISTNKWKPAADTYEYAFGDYSPDRYAFALERLRTLEAPIPIAGALGLWRIPEYAQLLLGVEHDNVRSKEA